LLRPARHGYPPPAAQLQFAGPPPVLRQGTRTKPWHYAEGVDAATASTSESTSERGALTPQGKPNLRPWQPGQSGNPSGRHDRGLVAYIKDQTLNGTELVDFVLSVLRDRNASTRHRLQAAEWLADRGFGRPALSVEPTAPQDGVSAARERLMATPPAERAALLRQAADALELAAGQDAETDQPRALPASMGA
jgi:hypothetical protein